ncbi:MAG: hypothetical protein P4L69_10780 [Desulfosporosinus sp.]|nr:hypothetical protein [Desulfosporosinus sp.]
MLAKELKLAAVIDGVTDNGARPKLNGVKDNGATLKLEEVTPKLKGATLKLEEVTPKFKGATPKFEEATLNTQDIVAGKKIRIS